MTSYTYDESTGLYDTKHYTAKFNKVEIIRPDASKTVQYINNISEYGKLDGCVYRTKRYKSDNGTLVSQDTITYDTYRDDSYWPAHIYRHADYTKGRDTERRISHNRIHL